MKNKISINIISLLLFITTYITLGYFSKAGAPVKLLLTFMIFLFFFMDGESIIQSVYLIPPILFISFLFTVLIPNINREWTLLLGTGIYIGLVYIYSHIKKKLSS